MSFVSIIETLFKIFLLSEIVILLLTGAVSSPGRISVRGIIKASMYRIFPFPEVASRLDGFRSAGPYLFCHCKSNLTQ